MAMVLFRVDKLISSVIPTITKVPPHVHLVHLVLHHLSQQPPRRYSTYVVVVDYSCTHRAQSGLIRRDREIRIFGYFSFFMHGVV